MGSNGLPEIHLCPLWFTIVTVEWISGNKPPIAMFYLVCSMLTLWSAGMSDSVVSCESVGDLGGGFSSCDAMESHLLSQQPMLQANSVRPVLLLISTVGF